MATHEHRMKDEVFEIDISPLTDGSHEYLFVARIARRCGDRVVPVCQQSGRREVYGSTEEWALRNAEALLDSGCCHDMADAA